MAIKFVSLLYKYLPAHYKVAPAEVEIYLDEQLDVVDTDRNRYLTTTIKPNDTEIYFSIADNLDPLKNQGVIKIENEYIKYDNKDLVETKLYNLERGFLNTEPVAHCNPILWAATLETAVSAFDTTIVFKSVTDMDSIPVKGKFVLYSDTGDWEVISYNDYNRWLNGYQFTNVTRGDDGTTPCKHGVGSNLQECASLLIEQVRTIKYDKGLWTASLSAAMTATATTATISSKFSATVNSNIAKSDRTIYITLISGTIPTRGYIKINNEIIRYGNKSQDDAIAAPTSWKLTQCVRASQSTVADTHSSGEIVYFTVPTTGEFIVDDEYIQYAAYDEVYQIFSGLLRGRYETTADVHAVGASLTERRHTELELTGLFRIGNEYFKYWYADNQYFYIDTRPALYSKTFYHTSGTQVSSIIEEHGIGAVIKTYHFDDENSYLVDFIHSVAEHLDLATNSAINKFEDFSDVDNVDADYLKYIVKELGENLDDYQNLPFFTGANKDYRKRLFTKELVNLYKSKGLLVALKLWHTVISEPLTSYQDLWTFNYCSFYSLPFLILILYEELRNFYPSNENFFRPQISKALQAELSEFYANKKIDAHPIYDLKLLVHGWEYFRKTDDDVKSSDGGSFDDRVPPCDSQNIAGIYYDPANVELQVRNTTDTVKLPFYVEDYDVDLFKFEEELDATKTTMPASVTTCYPITIDAGFESDYPFEWIPPAFFDYCVLADRLLPLRTDLEILEDLTTDLNNAELELEHNTTDTETELIVKVTNGKIYNPADHIITGTNPKIVPKGFVKFGNEIISYTGLEFYDHHEGTFTNKKYKLTGCARGVNSTLPAAYKINLFEGNERILNDNKIELVHETNILKCSVEIDPLDILTSAAHELETNDIVVFNVANSGAGILNKTLYYIYKIDINRFKLSSTPITGTVTPIVITSNANVICHRVHFRLLLNNNPKNYNVSVGDYLRLVLTGGYNYSHLITAIMSEYDYCTETYLYAIDFVTSILPIPTQVAPDYDVFLSSISTSTTYSCVINADTWQISRVNSAGVVIAHGLSDGDVVFFLAGAGNIDAYVNYYVSNAHTFYFELAPPTTPWTKTVTTPGVTNVWTSAAHGLSDGELVIFSGIGGGVNPGEHYLVTNATINTFKIRDVDTGDLIILSAGGNTITFSSIVLTGIVDIENTYMVSGTGVISTEQGYQHRYSLNQHLLWRLDNEVNGNDLELVYGLGATDLADKKLDTYKGVKDGIIWPTPHFKYGFEITTDDIANFPPDEVVELVLRKLKQYKPKHTVADLTLVYPLAGMQLGVTPLMEIFETENLMSDAYRKFNGLTNAGTDTIGSFNHDFHEGETVYIEGGDDAGLTFGTLYYVKYVDADTFRVSLTSGGAQIDLIAAVTVWITQAPKAEYRIELDHNAVDGIIDKTYDLPMLTTDIVTDYGATTDFWYTWLDGTPQQTLIYYAPFVAYPNGLIIDTYRNRKRFLCKLD